MQYALNTQYCNTALQSGDKSKLHPSCIVRVVRVVPSPVWRCFQATLVEPDMAAKSPPSCASNALDAVLCGAVPRGHRRPNRSQFDRHSPGTCHVARKGSAQKCAELQLARTGGHCSGLIRIPAMSKKPSNPRTQMPEMPEMPDADAAGCSRMQLDHRSLLLSFDTAYYSGHWTNRSSATHEAKPTSETMEIQVGFGIDRKLWACWAWEILGASVFASQGPTHTFWTSLNIVLHLATTGAQGTSMHQSSVPTKTSNRLATWVSIWKAPWTLPS